VDGAAVPIEQVQKAQQLGETRTCRRPASSLAAMFERRAGRDLQRRPQEPDADAADAGHDRERMR